MRSGESRVGMSPDMLRRIVLEVVPVDFSAEVCRSAVLADLDPRAIATFRERWAGKARKSGDVAESERVLHLPDEQLLRDAELLQPEGLTNAAVILLARGNPWGAWT